MFCYVSFEDSFIGQKISNDKGKLTACYNTKNTSLHKKKDNLLLSQIFPFDHISLQLFVL